MPATPAQRKFTLGLLTEWRKLGLPFGSETVVLAVSGGADSCALALGVSDLQGRGKLGCRTVVAHFDHGIRKGKSAEDARFVERLAGGLGFEFVTAKAPESLSRTRSNLEEKARDARYKFLHSAAKRLNSQAVLTAHTRNDQAETLLMNLIRGSGLSGLSGMDPVRPLGETGTTGGSKGHSAGRDGDAIRLYRPLLLWASREDTVSYVADCGVAPRIDSMNQDLSFQRVAVRKRIVPLLAELNPGIIDTLARTAETLRFEHELLSGDPNRLARSRHLAVRESIPVSELRDMSNALAVHTVRNWLIGRRGDLRGIDRGRLDAIVALAVSKKSGRTVELPRKGAVSKRQGRLFFEEVEVEK